MTVQEWAKEFKAFINELQMPRDDYKGIIAYIEDGAKLLKAQEQEISRLKHHIDCDAAEKLPSGCVGYGRGFNDDEPCETCKVCEKYNGYGEE